MTSFLSWEEAFVIVVLRNSFSVSGEGRGERVCILFTMYSITFLRFAFLIWRCARCFHRTFSQINFCHFSGEALSLPSAFVYFACGSSRTVCSTNSWISFNSTFTECSWDNQADSNAVQVFYNGPITDRFRPWIFSRMLSKSRSFCFFLSLKISSQNHPGFLRDWYFLGLDF